MEKIKDTKLGDWLKEKAPKYLTRLVTYFQIKGALGIVKNLLKKEPGIDQRKQRLRLMQRLTFRRMLQSDGRQTWGVM